MGPDNKLIPELEGLPYVAAKLEGDTDTVTNSLLEAHRLNSPYIISDKGLQRSIQRKSWLPALSALGLAKRSRLPCCTTMPMPCCMEFSWPTWRTGG